MTPVKFKGHNKVIGENQPEYQPLPALVLDDKLGTMISCWQLNKEELEEVKRTGVVYLQQSTFRMPMQPIYLSTNLADFFELTEGEKPDLNPLTESEKLSLELIDKSIKNNENVAFPICLHPARFRMDAVLKIINLQKRINRTSLMKLDCSGGHFFGQVICLYKK